MHGLALTVLFLALSSARVGEPEARTRQAYRNLTWCDVWTPGADEAWQRPRPALVGPCCGPFPVERVPTELRSRVALETCGLRWTYVPARQRLVVHLRAYGKRPLSYAPVRVAPGVFVDDFSWIVDLHADPGLALEEREGPVEVALLSRDQRLVVWIDGEAIADVEARVSRSGYAHVVDAAGVDGEPFDVRGIQVLGRPRPLPSAFAAALALALRAAQAADMRSPPGARGRPDRGLGIESR